MSRASEWAKAAYIASRLEPVRFEAEATQTGALISANAPPTMIHLAAGRRNDEATLSWTDHRNGGVVIQAHAAVSMARWILDTFGDDTR